MLSLKSVMRNAIESWRCEVSKDFVANKIAHFYHKLNLHQEPDAPKKLVLKVPGADDANNSQNFWRYNERISAEAKANMMDLLPAVLLALPQQRALDLLNQFLNPLGFVVAGKSGGYDSDDRDRLLASMNKETSEAVSAVLLLGKHASLDQLRAALKELVESKESHNPLLAYVEQQIATRG
ncbi:hypothetical protein [Photobacterium sp. GSS17]|uniref:hypothetical protein n=1 Tax=Photobacterium TaxID=657 RepID=UPI00235E3430|nr:hypothetical protein [Photobacterium sp. GSS17]